MSDRSKALIAKQKTLLAPQLDYILLDGSGSMTSKWWETLDGLQLFLKTLQAENVHSHGILHVFDSHDIEYLQRDAVLADWPAFRADPLGMYGGGTPLYDAINIMGRRLQELDPPRASIVIVTDGQENGSAATSEEQAAAILEWCRAKGWQVTFLGADFNNSRQAKALGATDRNSIGVQRSKLTDAGLLLGRKRLDNYRSGRDINFTDSEKSEFGGYLTSQESETKH